MTFHPCRRLHFRGLYLYHKLEGEVPVLSVLMKQVTQEGLIGCLHTSLRSIVLAQHFDYEEEDVSSARDRGIKSYELVVRTIATVGNYGTIELVPMPPCRELSAG